MLSLVSGRYPSGADQVAVTSGVASAFHLRVGDTWRVGGVERQVVGHRREPTEPPRRIRPRRTRAGDEPDRGHGVVRRAGCAPFVRRAFRSRPRHRLRSRTRSIPRRSRSSRWSSGCCSSRSSRSAASRCSLNGGMRSIGMLESTGATDRHVRLVISANGTVVGIVGAILGFVLGLVVWLAYRPSLEQSSHHVIGVLALPWTVVIAAMVLAVVAALLRRVPAGAGDHQGADRPGVVGPTGAPSSDPSVRAPRHHLPRPRLLVARLLRWHQSAATAAGARRSSSSGSFCSSLGSSCWLRSSCRWRRRLGRRAPIATRLALRDLARYRARSGSALAAISIGVLVAVIVMLAAASRYGNVLDYAGPNLSSNELALHANTPPPAGTILIGPNGQHAGRRATRRQTWRLPLSWPPAPSRSPGALGGQLSPSRRPMRS